MSQRFSPRMPSSLQLQIHSFIPGHPVPWSLLWEETLILAFVIKRDLAIYSRLVSEWLMSISDRTFLLELQDKWELGYPIAPDGEPVGALYGFLNRPPN